MRLSSVPFHREVRPGWDGGPALGPLPPRAARRRHRRIAPTAQYRRRCARRLGLVRQPGPFLVSRHPLFRRAARCWPSAGLFVGGQGACRQVTPGKPGCGLPLRGYRGLGPVRASVLLSRVLTEAGVAPAVHLRGPAPLAASPAHPESESGKYLQNSLCPAGRGEQPPTPVQFAGNMDTLVHGGVPAAHTAMEPSGRAGGSVKKETSNRKGHAHRRRKCKLSGSTGHDSSRCSQPAVST